MQANVQLQSLNSFTYKTGHRRTHTPKNKWRQLAFIRTLQPWRIGKLGVRVWLGTWPPRAVLPTCTCGARSPWKGTGIPSSSAPTQPTTVGLAPTIQNPTRAARILQMTRPATNDDQESPAVQKQGTTSKEPPTGYSSRSFISLPRAGWRDPLSGNSPPDWTGRFGCRRGQPRLEEGRVGVSVLLP